MAAVPTPNPWRSIKTFLLGLALFGVGGFLLGVSLILQAMGSMVGNPAGAVGIAFLLIGLMVALARLG